MNNRFANLICFASLAVILTSCSDEPSAASDQSPENCIVFETPRISFSEVETSRATMINSTLPTGSRFKVFGYCVPYMFSGSSISSNPNYDAAISKWNIKADYVHPDVFNPETTVTVTESGCTYSPLKQWYTAGEDGIPASAATNNFQYSFIALYPASSWENIRTEVAPADRGTPQFRYTMPYSGNTVNNPLNHNDANDAMFASRFDITRSDGQVGFNFDHLLAGIAFRIYNHNTTDDLTVNSLSLNGQFYRSATVAFASSTADPQITTTPISSDSYSGTFRFITNPLTCPAGAGNNIMAGDGSNPVTLLLLPDKNANETAFFGNNITLNITYSYGGEIKTKEIPFKMSSHPEGGKRYIAALNFVGDSFVLIFQDETDRWENGSDNDIIIN